MYEERRPRRLWQDAVNLSSAAVGATVSGNSIQYPQYPQQYPRVEFPHKANDVTEAAFHAIAATLYGQQRLDPNVVRNAMRSGIHGYRPVR